ncbi:MAG: glycosyltransferase family 4 protein [Patescibacteria group bacterium]
MKKKILIFSVAYHPFIGGAEVAVKEITDRLHEYEFDMVTLNLDGKQLPYERIGNIDVFRVGMKGRLSKLLFPFTAYYFANRRHRTEKYDATWSIMASFSGFAALFFKLIHPKIPFFLTLQEGDSLQHIKRQVGILYFLFKKIFKKADRIHAISQFLATFGKDMGATCPIVVIPNGVDTTVFMKTFSDAQLELVFKELGKEKGERLLITTSRLVAKNGIGDVIAAMALLPHSIKFAVIGIGPLEDTLRKQVADLKLTERVLFLGQKENVDLPKYLAVSDIFIRPSLSEGQGISFIEAMAAGIPVIATPVGGIPDFLEDRKTGLFCRVNDPQSIVESVTEILDNHELKEQIVQNAQDMAKNKYSWPLIVKRIDKEFLSS